MPLEATNRRVAKNTSATPMVNDDQLDTDDADDWQKWWDARVAAMEQVLGKSHNILGHAVVPFYLGAETGGAADIIYFHNHLDGIVSATSELIGNDEQIFNQMGNYELIVAHRDDEKWGPNLISTLAHYTLEAELNHRDTMDIGEATPDGSTIAALLFLEYARFPVFERECGLLLCIGITKDELSACRAGNHETVEAALKKNNIYPFTDLYRESLL